MKVDDCYQLGYVIKTHGLKGEVQIMLDVDDPSEYENLESMFVLQNQALVPFFLEYIQVGGKKAITKFEEIDHVDAAAKLVASEIYLPLSMLPSLGDGKYYFHQLLGMTVIENGTVLGPVTEFYELAPQNLIAVAHLGKEVLIPVNDAIVKKVDVSLKEIHVELPIGLIDVFLDDVQEEPQDED